MWADGIEDFCWEDPGTVRLTVSRDIPLMMCVTWKDSRNQMGWKVRVGGRCWSPWGTWSSVPGGRIGMYRESHEKHGTGFQKRHHWAVAQRATLQRQRERRMPKYYDVVHMKTICKQKHRAWVFYRHLLRSSYLSPCEQNKFISLYTDTNDSLNKNDR